MRSRRSGQLAPRSQHPAGGGWQLLWRLPPSLRGLLQNKRSLFWWLHLLLLPLGRAISQLRPQVGGPQGSGCCSHGVTGGLPQPRAPGTSCTISVTREFVCLGERALKRESRLSAWRESAPEGLWAEFPGRKTCSSFQARGGMVLPTTSQPPHGPLQRS